MNETTLRLMKKELQRLQKAHEKAKKLADEVAEAPSKYIALMKQAQSIIEEDKSIDIYTLNEKFKDLKKESDGLRTLMNKDYGKVLEKESGLRHQVEQLFADIKHAEWSLSIRQGAA